MANKTKIRLRVIKLSRVAALMLTWFSAVHVAWADASLRPGDSIDLKIGGVPSMEATSVNGVYMLDGEGNVNLPYVGRVRVSGLAPGTAQFTIESVYKTRGIYTSPNIVITMQAQSRFVNVGGQVKTPQRVQFTSDLTVLAAINGAGGFSPYADERKVRLLRHSGVTVIDVKKIRQNPSLDVQVQPGDQIEVPLSIF
jgi:protein involved in polysaccharide export with SLBB domain